MVSAARRARMKIPVAVIFLLCFGCEAFELPYLQTPPTVANRFDMPQSVAVSWLSWESDGGGDGPIAGYQVLYRYAAVGLGDGGYNYSQTVDSNVTTSVVIGGFDADTEYDFAVAVVRGGAGGAGPPTNKTTFRIACSASPGISAPLTLSVVRNEPYEIEIMWELPPESTWGCSQLGPLLSLFWKTDRDSSSFATVDLAQGSHNLSTLPCVAYEVTGQFYTNVALSPLSEFLNVTAARTALPPIGPVTVRLVPNSLDLEVSWPYPYYDTRFCLQAFYVTLAPVRLVACGANAASPVTQARVLPPNATGVVFGDLLPYAEYNATVRSGNEHENSTLAFRTQVTRQTLSSAVQGLRVAEVSPRTARLAWARIPCEDVHGRFYEYGFQFVNPRTGDSFLRYLRDVEATELAETQLVVPCATYDVQVRVESEAGYGPWSEKLQFNTTTEVPQSITLADATAVDDNPNALLVTWSDPDSVYCPIDYYEVSYKELNKFQCEDGDEVRVVAANATERSYTVTGLLPYSDYEVFVRAHNQAGFGSDGRIGVQKTAQKAPTESPIEVAVASYTDDWLHFSFQRADCNEGSWSSYLVTYAYQLDNLENTSEPVTGTSLATYVRFEGLLPYTRYAFRALIRTTAGDGPYSEPVVGRTNEDEPGPPAGLAILNQTETTMDVAWEAPTAPNGIVLNYTVQYNAIEKPYDPRFAPSRQYTEAALVGAAVFAHKVENLEPATKYSIRVAALTAPGEGEYLYREAFTKPKTDLQEPDQPAFDPSRSSGTSLYIYLYSRDVTYVTSYLVAVKKTSARRKRGGAVVDGELYGTYGENPDAYIAAELAKEDEYTVGFVVGDGRTYGGYLNAPLGKGTYSVRVGAASRADNASSVSWSEPLVQTVTGVPSGTSLPPTGKPAPSGSPAATVKPNPGSSSVGIIAGAVIAVVAVLIVIGLVVYYLRLRRKREVEDSAAGTPMEDTSKKPSVKV